MKKNRKSLNISLLDLMKKQEIFDKECIKARDNGFTPRKRTMADIYFSIDDEIQEWLRELPYEHNFKTWKQKKYSREDELIEFVDILFFILQLINSQKLNESVKEYLSENFEMRIKQDFSVISLTETVRRIKRTLTNFGRVSARDLLIDYANLARIRKFTLDDIYTQYLKKRDFNLSRLNGDWVEEEKC